MFSSGDITRRLRITEGGQQGKGSQGQVGTDSEVACLTWQKGVGCGGGGGRGWGVSPRC